MNYSNIKTLDISNGEGVRTSLFVSGCRHHCKGCFNKVAWDFNYGNPFTKEVEDYIIESLKPDYVQGLSILGGEPLEPENVEGLLPFIKRVKEIYPNKDIWCYTGYTYEDLTCIEIFPYIDVLVDGEFIEELKDISLRFRGSSNQRIIRLRA